MISRPADIRWTGVLPGAAPLLAVAMMAPLSLAALWLWSATPTVFASAHGIRPAGAGMLLSFALFLGAWMLMTAAMMLPSAMPLLLSLERMRRTQRAGHPLPLWAALSYLGVWGAVGVAVWLANAVAETFVMPHVSARVASGLAGAGLALAGLYGLSPLARACLRACRRPFGFLARYWRGGRHGHLQAVRIGAAYGVSCVGCCVPMIGLMFVVSMSHLAVVIGMGAVMVAMKSSALGRPVAALLALTLIAAGVAVGMQWLPLSPAHH